MPNVMAILPNIGGALCSTPQSLTSNLRPLRLGEEKKKEEERKKDRNHRAKI